MLDTFPAFVKHSWWLVAPKKGVKMITVRMPYAIERATAIAMTHAAFDDLSLGHRKVLANIVRFVNIGNIFNKIFAKKSTIARMANVSEETVYRAIKEFEVRGYLQRVNQSHDNQGYFGISEIAIEQSLADVLELNISRAPRTTSLVANHDAVNQPPASTEKMGGEGNRPSPMSDAHMNNGVPPTILRKQPQADPQHTAPKKPAIPEDLCSLQNRISNYAIFYLMKTATKAGKRLSSVVAYCQDAIRRLSGRDLVAYLLNMIRRDIDYTFLVKQQQEEVAGATKEQAKRSLIDRFMAQNVGRQFQVANDLLLHVETGTALTLYRTLGGDRERIGCVPVSIAMQRWPGVFGVEQ